MFLELFICFGTYKKSHSMFIGHIFLGMIEQLPGKSNKIVLL